MFSIDFFFIYKNYWQNKAGSLNHALCKFSAKDIFLPFHFITIFWRWTVPQWQFNKTFWCHRTFCQRKLNQYMKRAWRIHKNLMCTSIMKACTVGHFKASQNIVTTYQYRGNVPILLGAELLYEWLCPYTFLFHICQNIHFKDILIKKKNLHKISF